VGEIRLPRCTQPHVGCAEAANDAVRQRLCEPDTQNGRLIDVYFTVVVEIQL
jgi:hypothetical protein